MKCFVKYDMLDHICKVVTHRSIVTNKQKRDIWCLVILDQLYSAKMLNVRANMHINYDVKYLQLFHNHLSSTIWDAIWGSRVWQLTYVKFWAFFSFTGLPLFVAFSFVLVYRWYFLLCQKLTLLDMVLVKVVYGDPWCSHTQHSIQSFVR